MSMVKCNVVEQARTPTHEEKRADFDWDKHAAAEFVPPTPEDQHVSTERLVTK